MAETLKRSDVEDPDIEFVDSDDEEEQNEQRRIAKLRKTATDGGTWP